MAEDREATTAVRAIPAGGPRRAGLWAQFLALFAGVPLAMTLLFGLYPLFPVLIGFAIVALALLAVTPGFRLRELLRWPNPVPWPLIVGTMASFALLVGLLVLSLVPDRMLSLPRERPGLWVLILLLYPVFSALPQELIFRVLFFRRYGALFGSGRAALAANAAVFGLAHLFYQNWVAVGLSSLAGVVLGWAYQRHGSALLAILLHAIGGQIIFTLGLGVYFFHGAIGRSF